jgi:hypothetical protein
MEKELEKKFDHLIKMLFVMMILIVLAGVLTELAGSADTQEIILYVFGIALLADSVYMVLYAIIKKEK